VLGSFPDLPCAHFTHPHLARFQTRTFGKDYNHMFTRPTNNLARISVSVHSHVYCPSHTAAPIARAPHTCLPHESQCYRILCSRPALRSPACSYSRVSKSRAFLTIRFTYAYARFYVKHCLRTCYVCLHYHYRAPMHRTSAPSNLTPNYRVEPKPSSELKPHVELAVFRVIETPLLCKT
jgi:hypothetical protein